MLCVRIQAASLIFFIPLTNFTPLITSANFSEWWRRCHLFWADWQSLNAMVTIVFCEKQLLTLAVRSLTVGVCQASCRLN